MFYKRLSALNSPCLLSVSPAAAYLSACRESLPLSLHAVTHREEREKRTHARTHVRTQAAHTPASREYFHTRRGEQHGAVSRPGVANHSFAHAVQRIYTCLCVCVYINSAATSRPEARFSLDFSYYFCFSSQARSSRRDIDARVCVCVCVCDAAGRLYTWGDCRERCSGRRAPRTCD